MVTPLAFPLLGRSILGDKILQRMVSLVDSDGDDHSVQPFSRLELHAGASQCSPCYSSARLPCLVLGNEGMFADELMVLCNRQTLLSAGYPLVRGTGMPQETAAALPPGTCRAAKQLCRLSSTCSNTMESGASNQSNWINWWASQFGRYMIDSQAAKHGL